MTLLLLLACGRSPGPHDWEWGLVTYWQAEQAGTVSMTHCADSFEDSADRMNLGAGQFVTYRVEDGGELATEMDCTTTDGDTCRPNDDVVFDVVEHTLDTLIEEVTVVDDGCILNVDTEITLVDEGDTARFRNLLTTSYTGETCDEIEAEIVAASDNGYGFADCEVSVDGTLVFVDAD